MWATPPSPTRTRVRSSSICSAGESLEQAPARSEEHRDDVELELVEDAGGERAASRRSPRRSSSGRRRNFGSQMRASCSDGIERSVCPLHRPAKEFPIESDAAPLLSGGSSRAPAEARLPSGACRRASRCPMSAFAALVVERHVRRDARRPAGPGQPSWQRWRRWRPGPYAWAGAATAGRRSRARRRCATAS